MDNYSKAERKAYGKGIFKGRQENAAIIELLQMQLAEANNKLYKIRCALKRG